MGRVARCAQRNEQGCGRVQKPQEAPKAKALWKMKATKDVGEEYYDPEREDNIMGRSKTRTISTLGRASQRSDWGTGSSSEMLKIRGRRSWPEHFVEGAFCNGRCWLPHSIHGMERARRYGPHGELFFFLIQKEPATVPGSETFSLFFNADIRTLRFSANVLKKCALIALHLIAEEGRGGEDGGHAPGLVNKWKMGCPKSSVWDSDDEAWSEDKSVVKAMFGRKTKVCLPVALEKAVWATKRCTS